MAIEQLESRRLLNAGDPVETFGPSGTRLLPITEGFDAFDMIQLSTGRLLVLGGVDNFQTGNTVDAMRFKRDFTLDRTFGDNGAVNTFLTRIDRAFELPNGKILAQGVIDVTPNVEPSPGVPVQISAQFENYIIRLTADGALDTTFATKGHMYLGHSGNPFSSSTPYNGDQLAADADGNTLLFTASQIRRFTPRGLPDPTFGDDGTLAVSAVLGSSPIFVMSALQPLNNGDLLLVGAVSNQGLKFVRIDRSGELVFQTGTLAMDYGRGALELPSGDLLIAGDKYSEVDGLPHSSTRVMKFTAGGLPVSDFGEDGVFEPPATAGSYGSPGPQMILEPDGKVVLLGRGPLVRMDSDGAFDESFGLPFVSLAAGTRQPATLWNENTLLLAGGDYLMQLHTNGDDHFSMLSLDSGTLTITGTPQRDSLDAYFDEETNKLEARTPFFWRFFDAGDVSHVSMNGGDGDDIIYSGVANCTIDGGAGNDILGAIQLATTILGGDGDDEITGSEGDDVISGGNGRDKVLALGGDDTISGNAQNDTIYGGAGNDRLAGHGGRDKLIGENHNDRLFGGASGDWLLGGDGDDQLNGEGGNDYLEAGDGIDNLHGNAGNDRLITVGDSVIDLLNGDSGSDTGYADTDENPLSVEQLL